MAKLLLLNGPNLNLLGSREPDVYGHETLADIESHLMTSATALGHQLKSFQSNGEEALVNHIQQASTDGVRYAICNFGAFTHTSVAIRDALLGTQLPFIEVHISNVYARESFRHHSYFSDIANGVIVGLGSQGYQLALTAIDRTLSDSP